MNISQHGNIISINGIKYTIPNNIARNGNVSVTIDNGVIFINNWECKIEENCMVFKLGRSIVKVEANNNWFKRFIQYTKTKFMHNAHITPE